MPQSRAVTDKAVQIIRQLPRIDKYRLENNPGAYTTARQVSKAHNKAGKSHKELQIAAKPPLGWIFGDFFNPWHRKFPADITYNKDIHTRREYPPLSLLELQRMIDLGWIDTTKPIDLATLTNTSLYHIDPKQRQFGVQLTEEGADIFRARINIEVQWASDLTIATIERNGGSITAAYYDPVSLDALHNPLQFFKRGDPIPKRLYPPLDVLDMYLDPCRRGYLADPASIKQAQADLAQKYGYVVGTEQPDPNVKSLLSRKKKHWETFYGLEPGWVVNLKDRTVLKPLDDDVIAFYKS